MLEFLDSNMRTSFSRDKNTKWQKAPTSFLVHSLSFSTCFSLTMMYHWLCGILLASPVVARARVTYFILTYPRSGHLGVITVSLAYLPHNCVWIQCNVSWDVS